MIYLPQSPLRCLGGGVISSEYASIFALLGVKVTMIDRAPQAADVYGPRTGRQLPDTLSRKMVAFTTEVLKSSLYRGMAYPRWSHGSHRAEKFSSDKLLVALGRLANVENLGLEEAGVEQTDRGHIVVDEYYRTSVP